MPDYAFIDTNILLHFKFLDEVDWTNCVGAPEIVLVFAPVVLRELDKHKYSGSQRERSRAKAVLKLLDKLQLSPAPVALRTNVSILAIADEPDERVFRQHGLQGDVNDDRLLASLFQFRDKRKDHARVVLLTDDGALRVKARAKQIELVKPDDSLANSDEPDENQRRAESSERELSRLRNAAPKLYVTLQGNKHVTTEIRLVSALNNTTMDHLLKEWRLRNPMVRAIPDSFAITDPITASLKGLGGLTGLYSKEDAARHNALLDHMLNKYKQYLTNWPSFLNRGARTLELTFVVENSGTAPANGVHVGFSTDADGVWLEEPPELPPPPRMPKTRNLLDFDRPPQAPALLDLANLRFADRDIEGPEIQKGKPQRVEFKVERVTHQVPVQLPRVYFQFTTDASVRSFGIHCRLVAGNLTEPVTTDVHVEVKVANAAEPPLPRSVEQ